MKKIVLTCATVASITIFSTNALAGDSLGERTQLAVSTDLHFSTLFKNEEGSGNDEFLFQIQPAADYFVIDRLSVGGLVSFSNIGADFRFGIGPRAGYNISFSDSFSLWPKLALVFGYGKGVSIKGMQDASVDVSLSSLNLLIHAPLLWTPAEHFFVGIGPILETNLYTKAKAEDVTIDTPKFLIIGLLSTIGGYF